MRIRYALLFVLLFLTQWAFAQGWQEVDPYAYNDETVVYATLRSNVPDDPMSDFVVAAFVGDECRAEAASPVRGNDGSQFFILRVRGDQTADLGKEISFRVYHKPMQMTYDLVPSRPVTYTGESEGSPSQRIVLSLERQTGETVELESFFLIADNLAAGQTSRLLLQPMPANASFDVYAVELSFTGTIQGWTAVETGARGIVKENGVSNAYFDITPQYPGMLQVGCTVNGKAVTLRGETGGPLTSLEVGCLIDLKQGWQWRSNAYGDVTDQNIFGVFSNSELVEARTQNTLLYNDPTWGYFGTMMETGIPQNTCYKVKMASTPAATALKGGRYVADHSVVLDGEWTWVGVPYYFDRPLSEALNPAQLTLPEGMVIVSKEDGSAEFNGRGWTGDLTVLHRGQGVMVYSPLENPYTLTFAPEASFRGVRNEKGEMRNGAREMSRGSWHYDASRFMNNTTIVAVLADEESLSEDWTIGVFVGDECRGEGHYVDGRFFITAHTDRGERVTLKLRYESTGFTADIDETLTTGAMRMGSLRQPIRLHAPAVTQHIASSSVDLAPDTKGDYDLTGRRVMATKRGLVLRRQADGTVRKVIKH